VHVPELLQASLVAGLLGLDRLAFGQFMVSQPIVAAPIMGALLGDFQTGLLIGVVLELFWLRGLPVGGHVPADATLSAVLTSGTVLLAAPKAPGVDPAWIAWAFLWTGLLLFPARRLDRWIRRKKKFLIDVALYPKEPARAVARAVAWGGLISFLYYAGVAFLVFAFSGPFLRKGYGVCSATVLEGLRLFFFLLPVVGAGALLTYKKVKKNRVFLAAGAVLSFLFFPGPGEPTGLALAALFLLGLVLILVTERRRVAAG
jgi:mannose/fructose/N-acetylgalactosamine-specific phosphotransferase system component IIC